MQPLELQVGSIKGHKCPPKIVLQIYFQKKTNDYSFGSNVAGYDPQWPS